MSTLTQFFGGGGGGGSIPTEVLVVSGGAGASCLINNLSGQFYYHYHHGNGGFVDDVFFNILPGTTCSITVGAGGANCCRLACNPTCCYRLGGSGCASKFGDFGGVDRPQPDPTCLTCFDIYQPYRAFYPFTNSVYRSNKNCAVNALCFYIRAGCPAGVSGNFGHFGGNCQEFTTNCAAGCCIADTQGPMGFVSKITGTVQTYGSSKAWGYRSNVPNTPYFPAASWGGQLHPNTGGPGSGHGGYWCACSPLATVPSQPGTVVVQYPDDFDAASVSSPNVCDCSPATPGFRTYRFLCPGSITFP